MEKSLSLESRISEEDNRKLCKRFCQLQSGLVHSPIYLLDYISFSLYGSVWPTALSGTIKSVAVAAANIATCNYQLGNNKTEAAGTADGNKWERQQRRPREGEKGNDDDDVHWIGTLSMTIAILI